MHIKVILSFLIIFLMLGCESRSSKYSTTSTKDTTPPTLTLKGSKKIILPINSDYKEPGFIAFDDVDKDLTSKVEINSTLDLTKVGKYKIVYSIKDSSNNQTTKVREVWVTTYAHARLGALSDAKVEIYEVEPNSLKLIAKETTSSSENLEDIGVFDTHAYDLNSSKIYLFKVSNGVDWDSNNDGIKDEIGTINSGSIMAIATKEQIERVANSFNVTLLSSLSFNLVKKEIKYNFLNTLAKLEESANTLLNSSYEELLEFNPIDYRDIPFSQVRENFLNYVELIHKNKNLALNLTPKITNIATYDFARALTKIENSIYLADGDGGVSVIDLESKEITKNIKTKDFARRVILNSTQEFAFVADSKAGFSIIDLNLQKVIANIPTYEDNTSSLDYDARDVILNSSEDLAYIAASKKGIMVVDISNINNPKLVKYIKTIDSAYHLELLDENRALVADGRGGVLVINLDTNETISRFDTYGIANNFTLNATKDRIYIADGYKGVVIADISDIENILYLNHVDTPDYASKIVLNRDETTAYVADRKSNIQIINLNDEKPYIINSIATPYRSYDLALSSKEDIAYVATGVNGLEIVAINYLENPAILSEVSSDYKAYSIAKKDNYLYVNQGYKGLEIIDASNPLNLEFISSFDTNGFAINSAIEDSTLYLANGKGGLVKVDISNNLNLNIVDNLPTNNFTYDVAIIPNSNYLLVSDSNKSVNLVDKESLKIINSLTTSNKAGNITLSKDGKTAYVAVGENGVDVIKIDDNNLTKLSTINLQRYIKSITLNRDEDIAYLVGEDGVVTIYDLKEDNILANLSVGGFSNYASLSSDESYLYVADSNNKIAVINLQNYEPLGEITLKSSANYILIEDNIAYIANTYAGVVDIDLELLK